MSSSLSETAGARGDRAIAREECPHLSDIEWAALQRMASSIGEAGVAALLHSLLHDDQHATVAQFIHHELDEARSRLSFLEEQSTRQAEQAQHEINILREQNTRQTRLLEQQQQQYHATADRSRRPKTLKIEISKYRGAESDSLLRWLVELEDAISARRIEDDAMRITFAMSDLTGRAKAWAYGLKLRDPYCFSDYEDFKSKLREAFEPPKSEFRAHTEFLDIKRGKRDIHAYAAHARYLVSCVVDKPIDDQTQVVTYIKGLVDGPIKTHLFREYPETMEVAIAVSLQEEFSLKQAYVHSSSYRPPRRDDHGGAEPMDLSVADTSDLMVADGNPIGKPGALCGRCKKPGHFAYECLAPHPVSRPTPNVSQHREC